MWGRAALYLVYLVAGTAAMVAWYLFFRRYNRRQGEQVLAWIAATLDGSGEVMAVSWLGPSLLRVALRLDTSLFQRPALTVRLVPRQMPLEWLRHWWRGEPATITWQADLDIPPSFNLQAGQHRWCGRSRKRLVPDRARWTFEPVTPLILTSRRSWPREVTAMMSTLLSCREREVLSLGFRSTSPHFSAVIPLACISPEGRAGGNIYETLRELAAGASASRR